MTDRLNPDALKASAKAIFDIRDDEYDLDEWEDLNATERERYECDARAAVSAYLAALPAPRTITTTADLEALPVGTVIYAANHIGPAERFDVGWMGCGNNAAWSSALLARDGLPARVLWVPTEGGEGCVR